MAVDDGPDGNNAAAKVRRRPTDPARQGKARSFGLSAVTVRIRWTHSGHQSARRTIAATAPCRAVPCRAVPRTLRGACNARRRVCEECVCGVFHAFERVLCCARRTEFFPALQLEREARKYMQRIERGAALVRFASIAAPQTTLHYSAEAAARRLLFPSCPIPSLPIPFHPIPSRPILSHIPSWLAPAPLLLRRVP